LTCSFSETSTGSSMSSDTAKRFDPCSTRKRVAATKKKISTVTCRPKVKEKAAFNVLPLGGEVEWGPPLCVFPFLVGIQTHQILHGGEVIVGARLVETCEAILVLVVDINLALLRNLIDLLGSVQLLLANGVKEEDVHIKVIASLKKLKKTTKKKEPKVKIMVMEKEEQKKQKKKEGRRKRKKEERRKKER